MKEILLSLLYSPNLFMTYQLTNTLNFLIGKFINIKFTFKMSPRTLIFVENWWSYNIIWIYLLFLVVFYHFVHISVSNCPNNMILGLFKQIFQGYHLTGLVWIQSPVRSPTGPGPGPGLLGSSPIWSRPGSVRSRIRLRTVQRTMVERQ